jgi:hypothetical protein
MKKVVFFALILALASVASASAIYQTCGSAAANVVPPPTASMSFSCGPNFVNSLLGGVSVSGLNFVGGDYITSIELYANDGVTSIAGYAGQSSGVFSGTASTGGAPSTYFDMSATTFTGGSNSVIETLQNCTTSNATACTQWYNYLVANTGSNQLITTNAGSFSAYANGVSASYTWEVDYGNVPEPATISLIGGALLGLGVVLRRKKRA